MAIYAIGITPLLDILIKILSSSDTTTTMVAFADDITGAGKISTLKKWWNKLCDICPKFGYFPQPSKSWLIVKENHLTTASEVFEDTTPISKLQHPDNGTWVQLLEMQYIRKNTAVK